tara:strand:- start:1560 stop:1775 length:216 start_codon:yes stop_codon:yes gene_type:complete
LIYIRGLIFFYDQLAKANKKILSNATFPMAFDIEGHKIKLPKELLKYHFKKVLIYIQTENIVGMTHKNMYL